MTHEKPNLEQPMAENPPLQEPGVVVEKKELTPQEEIKLARVAIDAIGGEEEGELSQENWKKAVEKSILDGVHELPEWLANRQEPKTVNTELLNAEASRIIYEISQEKNLDKIAELQIELIYQYIGIISRVQNGGQEGFTPALAKEVKGLDCSLSTWALKEKLQNSGIKMPFKFGGPNGHVNCVITLADGRDVLVDAQNGYVEAVELKEVDKTHSVFEIESSKRIAGHLPNEEEVTRTRKDGSDYVPKYLSISEDGIPMTLGNMHMFVAPESPTFHAEIAKKFRRDMGINVPESELSGKKWEGYYQKFDQFVNEAVSNGKTIYGTPFEELQAKHHQEYQEAKDEAENQEKINSIKENSGI